MKISEKVLKRRKGGEKMKRLLRYLIMGLIITILLGVVTVNVIDVIKKGHWGFLSIPALALAMCLGPVINSLFDKWAGKDPVREEKSDRMFMPLWLGLMLFAIVIPSIIGRNWELIGVMAVGIIFIIGGFALSLRVPH